MDLRILLAAFLCLGTAASRLIKAPQRNSSQANGEDINYLLETIDSDILENDTATRTKRSQSEGCGWPGVAIEFKFGESESMEQPEFGEYKWTVAIIHKNNNSYCCGGSLIHRNVVLTVGTRFNSGSSWVARAGEWRFSTNAEFRAHQDRDVAEVVLHPRAHKTRFNIGLMFVETPFVTGPHIGFVCLPPIRSYTPPGTKCFVTGWGHEKHMGGRVQDAMKLVELPIVGKSDCERRLRPHVGPAFDLHGTTLCAGGVPGQDTCRKDGGSPLVCPYSNDSDRYYQVGIVSAGFRCGLDVPALYTDVAAMRSWIDSNIQARGYSIDSYTT